ncbi:MCE family protein [Amycolatopsis jiangsuensis]|uniref:Phospholipid/cholesterol/gamma-HCH transport system substrate-binding protein n=1 Tax=Amycolatopsis jiangsuensis TaxID=1181879 RepID=A0A840J3S4_9PSEU|nr:MCE family protein [Amycolatopsis jiangsuensis]MBB4688710.1 phospholipid/cholesterol/gamma-HCH transport system substrate-binding protein [Amycolatopsis jiangsuensis]
MNRALKSAAVLALVLGATGCGSGLNVYDLPLPGGAPVGDNPIHLTASFTNVLDLVPQSAVKVDDVAVGKVSEIELASDGRSAIVGLTLDHTVDLPANSVARVRQASILGEKFVELAPPPDATPAGKLRDGAVLPLDTSSLTPEIEEVFGALSLLLNGGGVAQVQNISHQLNEALGGKESAARSLLSSLDTLTTGLDRQRGEITHALDSVNKLAGTLSAHREEITVTLNDLTPGIKVLDEQKQALTGMLDSLDGLTSVAVDTVNRSKDDLVADLKALAPLLHRLADAGDRLPKAMEMLFTFPFPDAALDAIRGDYLNTFVRKGS